MTLNNTALPPSNEPRKPGAQEKKGSTQPKRAPEKRRAKKRIATKAPEPQRDPLELLRAALLIVFLVLGVILIVILLIYTRQVIPTATNPTATQPPESTAAPPTVPPTPIPTQSREEFLREIKERKIRVGVSKESGPYTYYDESTETYKGFEIELVREFVKQWLDLKEGENPDDHIDYVEVSVSHREPKPPMDFVAAAVTYIDDITRCGDDSPYICTTISHFTEKDAFAVHIDAGINGYCDSALGSSTTTFIVLPNTKSAQRQSMDKYAERCGFVITNAPYPSTSRIDAVNLVANHTDIDGIWIYKTDSNILEFYRDKLEYDNTLQVVVDSSSPPQQYVFWLPKEKTGLRDLIDETLKAMKDGDRYKEICEEQGKEDKMKEYSMYFSPDYCNAQ